MISNFVPAVGSPRERKSFEDFLKENNLTAVRHMDDIVVLGRRADVKSMRQKIINQYSQ